MVVALMICMGSDRQSPAARRITEFVPEQRPQALDVTTTTMTVVVVKFRLSFKC